MYYNKEINLLYEKMTPREIELLARLKLAEFHRVGHDVDTIKTGLDEILHRENKTLDPAVF